MSQNPFEILGIIPAPILDLNELRLAYRTIQRIVHPDLGNDVEASEKVNYAYQTLKNDESRIGEILKLSKFWPPNPEWMDPEFLMDAMDLGEEIDSLERTDENALNQITFQMNQWSKYQFDTLQMLHEQWINTTDPLISESLLKQLSVWFQKNRYISRLQKNLNQEHEI
jgi:curved DNA-binding protein CbpA